MVYVNTLVTIATTESWYSQPTQNDLNGTSKEVSFKPVIPGLKRQVSVPILKLIEASARSAD